jgi:hypothetical protein
LFPGESEINIVKEEWKAAFGGRGFRLSFLLMLLTMVAYSLPLYLLEREYGEGWPNAFQLAVEPIFFGGVILVFPFCGVMAHALSQVTEIQTGFLPMKVIRGGVSRIALHKAVAASLAGGLAPMLAFVAALILWHLLGTPIDPSQYPHHEIFFSEGVLYQNWYHRLYGLPMYASLALGMFLTGIVWAVIGLAAATWLPDKLFATVFVNVVYTVWMFNFPRQLFDIPMATPEALFNDGLTAPMAVNALLCNGVAVSIAYWVYWAGMKRRFGRA